MEHIECFGLGDSSKGESPKERSVFRSSGRLGFLVRLATIGAAIGVVRPDRGRNMTTTGLERDDSGTEGLEISLDNCFARRLRESFDQVLCSLSGELISHLDNIGITVLKQLHRIVN